MKPRILLGSFLENKLFLTRLLSKFEVEIINVKELEVIIRDEREKLADLILLDLSEKEEEGWEMLSQAKLNPEKIPVIIIGDTRDENLGIECIRKGVQEFIIKSHLTENILSTAIVHAIERHRFSQESKKKVQRTYDFLGEGFNKIEAQKNNKVKDNFFAIVSHISHELKNPLTAILCLAKYMQQVELDKEKANELLKRIEKSAKTQEQLINDLLDVSQIVHEGNLGIQTSKIDLKELTEEILVTLREEAGEKSITIDSRLSKACIVGDPVRLQQIVTNLIGNAIKFTPKDGKIRIRLSQTTKSEIKIEIKDTGVGIDPEFLPHAFEFFRRENGKGTKNVKGMGLGLGIVKNLVESHQGTITAESPGKGKGSTFKVSLPMITCPSENEGS